MQLLLESNHGGRCIQKPTMEILRSNQAGMRSSLTRTQKRRGRGERRLYGGRVDTIRQGRRRAIVRVRFRDQRFNLLPPCDEVLVQAVGGLRMFCSQILTFGRIVTKVVKFPVSFFEKFGAPEGSLYDDIRPQGSAMGVWLGAWASLGARRLANGLAMRPTQAFQILSSFFWRGRIINFNFEGSGTAVGIVVNGTEGFGTLQIPESALSRDENEVGIL